MLRLDCSTSSWRAADARSDDRLAVSLDEGVGKVFRKLNPFGAIHVVPRARVATRNAT